MSVTENRNDPGLKRSLPNGQQEKYLVLNEEARKRGWVRPYRDTYKHVGLEQPANLRELTTEEHERYDQYGYVAFETYDDTTRATGRFWTQEQLDGGCGAVTTMGEALSETYAKDPTFYGATFCCGCGVHAPIDEFVWLYDGERVGS